MKTLRILGLLTAATTGLAGVLSASPALADNAAGSASFSMDGNGVVRGAAMAASVGERSALAVATNTPSGNWASALGSSSYISHPDVEQPMGGRYIEECDCETPYGHVSVYTEAGVVANSRDYYRRYGDSNTVEAGFSQEVDIHGHYYH